VKHRTALYFASLQSIAYRQTNLASNVPNVAKNVIPGVVNPLGIAFLSGQPLFTSDNKDGRVTSLDATELSGSPGTFIVPNSAEQQPSASQCGSRKERP
jgi:hypothetical protein